jgi:N-methylhydantoinase B
VACGGGGFGDPLERDPELVKKDAQLGLVSPHCAEEIYGVVFTDGLRAVDYARTKEKRAAIQGDRAR